LHGARADASSISEAARQRAAMTMVHFYSGVIFHKCGEVARARYELTEFFRLHPGHSKLDPSKFDASFLSFFADVQRERETGGRTAFDRAYPGFELEAPAEATPESLRLWGASSEFLLLATEEERERWNRLETDLDRSAFVSRFWQRRQTHQSELLRRVRFAEHTFPSLDERGALTDRGRVFVLLGAPARVYRQALQRGQTILTPRNSRRPLEGELERWVYSPAQIPAAIPAAQIEFRFVTQPGYGQGVMEKDFMALKALEEARKAILAASE
jgi:GWxTD domain-containing protein